MLQFVNMQRKYTVKGHKVTPVYFLSSLCNGIWEKNFAVIYWTVKGRFLYVSKLIEIRMVPNLEIQIEQLLSDQRFYFSFECIF